MSIDQLQQLIRVALEKIPPAVECDSIANECIDSLLVDNEVLVNVGTGISSCLSSAYEAIKSLPASPIATSKISAVSSSSVVADKSQNTASHVAAKPVTIKRKVKPILVIGMKTNKSPKRKAESDALRVIGMSEKHLVNEFSKKINI